jgi:hypothetical protein
MSGISLFNSSKQVISGLYNLSTFSSYKPGFTTITSDVSKTKDKSIIKKN